MTAEITVGVENSEAGWLCYSVATSDDILLNAKCIPNEAGLVNACKNIVRIMHEHGLTEFILEDGLQREFELHSRKLTPCKMLPGKQKLLTLLRADGLKLVSRTTH